MNVTTVHWTCSCLLALGFLMRYRSISMSDKTSENKKSIQVSYFSLKKVTGELNKSSLASLSQLYQACHVTHTVSQRRLTSYRVCLKICSKLAPCVEMLIKLTPKFWLDTFDGYLTSFFSAPALRRYLCHHRYFINQINQSTIKHSSPIVRVLITS